MSIQNLDQINNPAITLLVERLNMVNTRLEMGEVEADEVQAYEQESSELKTAIEILMLHV